MALFFQRQIGKLHIVKKFFNIMGIRPIHIVAPIILSFITAAFAGIGTGLLIPLAKGIVGNDFTFIDGIPVLRHVRGVVNMPPFKYIPSPNLAIFFAFSLLIVTAQILNHILSYISIVLKIYWNGLFEKRIQEFVFNRFLGFGKMYFDKISQGYVRSILSYSTNICELYDLFRETLKHFFDITVHFIIMLIISWKLTLYTLVIFPVFDFCLRRIINVIKDVSQKDTQMRIQLSREVFNMLSCIPLIKVYAKENQMKKVYSQRLEDIRKLGLRKGVMKQLISPIQNIIILFVLLLMVAFVVVVIAKDRPSDLATFFIFLYIADTTLPKFRIFSRMKAEIAAMKPPIKEVFAVFDDKEKFLVPEGDKVFKGLNEKIDIQHLSFEYTKGYKVLEDINLTLKKGEMTAIVGPTGVGKTTLVNLLMRHYDYTSGAIKIDGRDIKEFTTRSLRDHMSIVTQDIYLFNDTLKNNITFGANGMISETQLMDVIRKARLYDFIMGLPDGLKTIVGDRGVRLSGGEQQRVSIARALLRNTQILILDEATSSLDTHTEQLIQQSIEEAVKGRTTIVIAHRLFTIKNADKIAVIEKGRVIEYGPLPELLKQKGKFYQYWQAQTFY